MFQGAQSPCAPPTRSESLARELWKNAPMAPATSSSTRQACRRGRQETGSSRSRPGARSRILGAVIGGGRCARKRSIDRASRSSAEAPSTVDTLATAEQRPSPSRIRATYRPW